MRFFVWIDQMTHVCWVFFSPVIVIFNSDFDALFVRAIHMDANLTEQNTYYSAVPTTMQRL